MQQARPQDMKERLKPFVEPWFRALADPSAAQQAVLEALLQGYARTQYGQKHKAGEITDVDEYRHAFPVVTYDDLEPLMQRTMAGETNLLLYEEPVGWAITRGTTRAQSKFIPMTPTDLKMRVSAARAMINWVMRTGQFQVFQGVNLNLNFPSVVGRVRAGGRDVEYGYSSGIYVKYVSKRTPMRSLPTQDEIDALGGGKTVHDWERRFELAYERCKDEDVTMVGGVAPTDMTDFMAKDGGQFIFGV